jgi:hypothetical protein
MLVICLSIADTKQQEYVFAHLEIGGSNCGAFNFRRFDFEIFESILVIGCRALRLDFIREEFDVSTNT